MELSPLPRGRHGLSRDDVAASQRVRLERAVTELVAVQGFAGTTVQQVVAAASVSRQTFYELYSCKEDCYEAALHGFAMHVLDVTRGAFEAPGLPIETLEAGLRGMLEGLAAQPALAHCLLFEAAGSAAQRAGRGTPLRETFQHGVETVLGTSDPFAVHAFTAMTRQLLEEAVADGEFETLPDLAPEIIRLIRVHLVHRDQ